MIEQKRNLTVTTIALLAVLTFSGLVAIIPTANAHTPPWTITTYAFINVAPNPVGVGQTAYVNFWIDKVPPTAEGNWGYKWHNMTVTMTKPDGTTQILGPFDSDAVGGAWTSFVPDQLGTYRFVGHFPTQVVKNENPYPFAGGFIPLGVEFINDTYTGSTSKEVALTVQAQQVQTAYPPNPLPTDYWQRPINSMNREWSSIGGNWLGLAATSFGASGLYDQNGNFNPYTTAPNSAHVLWTKPLAFGGQIGGEFGPSETSLYATGTAYEAKFGAVILNGNLYYTDYPGAGNDPGPLTAVDMRTGKTLWTVDAKSPLRCGMVYNFITGDQYGAHAYLFTAPASIGFIPYPPGNAWSMYDAMTGAWILDIANATAGTLVEGPNGEILSYLVAGNTLTMWNSSKCVAAGSQKNNFYTTYSSAEIWRPPQGATIDWQDGNQWTVPIASDISGVPILGGLSLAKIDSDVVLMTAGTSVIGGVPGGSQLGYRIDVGYSAADGHLIWGPINRTLTPWTNVVTSFGSSAGDGVYVEYTNQLMTWTGYDITTGQKLWGPTAPNNSSWAYYDFTAPSVIGYGNLYTFGLSGEVYCYDVHTGALKWSWYAGNAGVDSPFGTWPLGTWNTHHILADGKLYVRAGHDYTPPVFKGAKLYCIDAFTGQEVWSSLSFDIVSSPAVADGIMLWDNGYDNQIYAYGQGLSATTVSAPELAVSQGQRVLLQGTVTDQSPGETCLGIPAAGTPAISDASQSAWMEYLYQQQPKPDDATGVQVHLTAIDPNGNFQDIGTTTSDIDGTYAMSWTPPIPGVYKVTATFAGTNSYYSSTGTTHFLVEAAASAQPTSSPTVQPSQAPQPGTNEVPMTTYIAIAAAVVIVVAVAAALVLRRRK
jgi:outer membrane protein assembly factor BamB